MPVVSTTVMRWARETAGLAIDDAARKIGINQDRLEALEAGVATPTRRQLEVMAEKYRRPLVAFYLREPPAQSDRGQDFRTLPEEDRQGSEALLGALIRDVQARHALLKSALEDTDEAAPLPYVGSASVRRGVDALVLSLQQVLGVTKEDFRRKRTVDEAFALLRSRAERAGVFVILMGNLGTHHTDISVKTFRGFAIADNIAPFVVINEKDSRAAWSFTLLHELAHICLGQTGISGYDGEAEIEKFCDRVASKFLLDDAELDDFANPQAGFDDLVARIGEFASNRNVSRGMVAYNLLRTGVVARAVYLRLVQQFDRDRNQRQEATAEREGGPNYYVVRRHRLGQGMVEAVGRFLKAGVLSTTKAGTVLGVKPTAVPKLVGGSGI